jgi:ABC-type transport system substrate-binding protein
MRMVKLSICFLSVMLLISVAATTPALAGEQPRHGGTLQVALAGDPPSLDMHQESTFMVTIPMSPAYNTLIMFDPQQLSQGHRRPGQIVDGLGRLPHLYLQAA